jgi:hypothetical protein
MRTIDRARVRRALQGEVVINLKTARALKLTIARESEVSASVDRPSLRPIRRQEALARLPAGETQADIARTYNVDATTIGRLQ